MSPVEENLKKILDARTVPEDLALIYSNLHPEHGGIELEVHGSGLAVRRKQSDASSPLKKAEARVPQGPILKLVETLLQIGIFAIPEPSNLAVRGAIKENLTIRVAGEEFSFWKYKTENPMPGAPEHPIEKFHRMMLKILNA